MLVIDGSNGEGGGQILRTSLTLAMITGTPISLINIRAGRAKPGLLRQHLTCVQAAQAISDAEVSGAQIGSQQISFAPGKVKAGEYEFAVGTAGSTLLVFQTILPALALADGESSISFEGGTHNMFAPSFDFVALAYRNLLCQAGVEVEMNIERHGFYPNGGGIWQALIKPAAEIRPLSLLHTGALIKKEAVVTSANIARHVAKRELDEIARRCNWSEEMLRVKNVESPGSGNIVSIRLHYENCIEVNEVVGKLGVSAEKIASDAVSANRRYQAANVPVGKHLADQLLLIMAMAKGGVFRTLKPSQHTLTNISVIEKFIDQTFQLKELGKDSWEIELS